MDFVERWFGIFPDGGNGVFEATTIVTLLVIGAAFVFRTKLQTALYKRIRRNACLQ
jgi:hypothetical protein